MAMEGERFFSPINFLQALMAAEAGEEGAPSFPGLCQDELRRIVLGEMFSAAWNVLEGEGGAWNVEMVFADGEESCDDVVISHKADGCVFVASGLIK